MVALRQKGSLLLAVEQSIGYPFARAAPGVAIYLKEFGGDSAKHGLVFIRTPVIFFHRGI